MTARIRVMTVGSGFTPVDVRFDFNIVTQMPIVGSTVDEIRVAIECMYEIACEMRVVMIVNDVSPETIEAFDQFCSVRQFENEPENGVPVFRINPFNFSVITGISSCRSGFCKDCGRQTFVFQPCVFCETKGE